MTKEKNKPDGRGASRSMTSHKTVMALTAWSVRNSKQLQDKTYREIEQLAKAEIAETFTPRALRGALEAAHIRVARPEKSERRAGTSTTRLLTRVTHLLFADLDELLTNLMDEKIVIGESNGARKALSMLNHGASLDEVVAQLAQYADDDENVEDAE